MELLQNVFVLVNMQNYTNLEHQGLLEHSFLYQFRKVFYFHCNDDNILGLFFDHQTPVQGKVFVIFNP